MWGMVEAARKAANDAAVEAQRALYGGDDAAAHTPASPGDPESTAARARRQELHIRLKHWKAHFTDEHERPPTHADLSSDPAPSECYREFKELSARLGEPDDLGLDAESTAAAKSPQRAPASFPVGAAVAVTSAHSAPVRGVVTRTDNADGVARCTVEFGDGTQQTVPAGSLRPWHAFDDLAEGGAGGPGAHGDLVAEATAQAREAAAAASRAAGNVGGWFASGLASASAKVSSAIDKGIVASFEGFVAEEKGRERRVVRIVKGEDRKVGLAFKNLIITSVAPGGPADKAGVAVGMRIVAVAGSRVYDHDGCLAAFGRTAAEFELVVETDKAGDEPVTALVRAGDELDGHERWISAIPGRMAAAQRQGDEEALVAEKRRIQDQWSEAVDCLHALLQRVQGIRLAAAQPPEGAGPAAGGGGPEPDLVALAEKQLRRAEEVMAKGDAAVAGLAAARVPGLAAPQPLDGAAVAGEPTPASDSAAAAGSPRKAIHRLRTEAGSPHQSQPSAIDFGAHSDDASDELAAAPPAPAPVAVALSQPGKCVTESFDEVVMPDQEEAAVCTPLDGELPAQQVPAAALSLGAVQPPQQQQPQQLGGAAAEADDDEGWEEPVGLDSPPASAGDAAAAAAAGDTSPRTRGVTAELPGSPSPPRSLERSQQVHADPQAE